MLAAFPVWFWAALAIGAAARLFFATATPGTFDVDVWLRHTIELENRGLIAYYQRGPLQFNHPPPAAWLMSSLARLAEITGLSFSTLLRLPFALFDLASVFLLLRLLSGSTQAYWLAAAFWLHPLAILFSSYHGNTDSSVAFFLLAATLMASRNNGLLAGVILGLGLWLKIPGVLAAPVLLFALNDWKQRTQFCVAGGLTALAGFAPALALNPQAVVEAVFLYSGLAIRTSSGITTWGLLNLLPDFENISTSAKLTILDIRAFVTDYNILISLGPLLIFAWLRRHHQSAIGIATSLSGSFALFYGLTNFWAFQYFAWSIPFWLLGPRWFAWSASLFATFYVYGAYAWLCGDPLLLGPWDFIGKPDWPAWLVFARNAANVYFLVAGVGFFVQAVRESASK